MPVPGFQSAIDAIPAGPWAVGVSGGADSVALLSLLHTRAELQLTVVHLDHETRAGASAADAEFVRDLCDAWRIPCVVETLSAAEPDEVRPERNLPARWRLARLALYRRVVRARHLRGVILAHHADDQAETVFHRLLRGSAPAGLTGMSSATDISGLTVLRPLLKLHRHALRAHLHAQSQAWREDQSNESPRYARNRIRRLLSARPALIAPLIELGGCCRELSERVDAQAPVLSERFQVADVRALPPPVARRALSRWVRDRTGVPAEPSGIDALFAMTLDAASPSRRNFPGNVLVCRRGGTIFVADH